MAGFVSQCGVIIEPALFCVLDVDQNKHIFVKGLHGLQVFHKDPESQRSLKVARAGW
jgi:hypothetical protein